MPHQQRVARRLPREPRHSFSRRSPPRGNPAAPRWIAPPVPGQRSPPSGGRADTGWTRSAPPSPRGARSPARPCAYAGDRQRSTGVGNQVLRRPRARARVRGAAKTVSCCTSRLHRLPQAAAQRRAKARRAEFRHQPGRLPQILHTNALQVRTQGGGQGGCILAPRQPHIHVVHDTQRVRAGTQACRGTRGRVLRVQGP